MADGARQWICTRQRAGPLVKESRALRPRLGKSDSPSVRAEKNEILRPNKGSPVCHDRVDRLELRLALFGREGWFYTLTFDDEHLPPSFKETRKAWYRFLARVKKRLGGAFDYIYCIEGKHGDHRYHVHMVVRGTELPPSVVEAVWRQGFVRSRPLLSSLRDTYRDTAVYMCKERTDGVVTPIGAKIWACSKSLAAKLPPPERWECSGGEIWIPEDVLRSNSRRIKNDWGVYNYAWYIK